jgi:hypothetical protein
MSEGGASATTPRGGWRAWVGSRYAAPLVIALALGIAALSLGAGFDADDRTFRVLLRDGVTPSYDLFHFSGDTPAENLALVRTGILPWWTNPELKLHLLRPLTSLAFTLDCAVFGRHPLGYHVHSLAWFAALLVGAWLLLRRVLPGPTGVLALFVFSLRAANAYPYAWVAARHILVAAVPALFALYAHVRARTDGWRPGRWLAPLLFALALAGSEAGLAITPFWLTYAFFEGRATRDWKRAIAGATPVTVLAVVYLAAYHALGGGARGNSDYHDALLAPGELLRVAVVRIPLLLSDALLGVPVGEIREGRPLAIVALGVCAVGFCALYWRFAKALTDAERASLAWLVTGSLASLPMGLPGPPWGHMLVVPGIGFAALVGALIREGLEAAGGAPSSMLRRLASGFLLFMHGLVAPLESVRAIHWIEARGAATETAEKSIDLGDEAPKRVFVLAADQRDVAFFPRDYVNDETPGRIACWSTLSGLGAEHRVTRTGERSFSIEAVGEPESQGYTGIYFSPLPVGYEVQQCGATVRVDALGEGGLPSRLSVQLDAPLESPGIVLLALRDGRFTHFTPPAVNGTTDLPWGTPGGATAGSGIVHRAKRAILRAFGQ